MRPVASRTGAFTLIELMIVMSIISIITAVAVPNLIEARNTGNSSAAISALRTLVTTQQLFRDSDRDDNGASTQSLFGQVFQVDGLAEIDEANQFVQAFASGLYGNGSLFSVVSGGIISPSSLQLGATTFVGSGSFDIPLTLFQADNATHSTTFTWQSDVTPSTAGTLDYRFMIDENGVFQLVEAVAKVNPEAEITLTLGPAVDPDEAFRVHVQMNLVPEPSTCLLVSAGIVLLAGHRHRARHALAA